ncbi:MAG: tRNA 4-thiouridine(8) synthase ThiI, partial [Methanobacteriota archaeon]
MPMLLVRYGELGLKSERVRRRFEAALEDDIRGKHAMAGIPCLVSSSRGRIFVDSNDWRRSCEMLSRTFGVVSFSPATRVGSDL